MEKFQTVPPLDPAVDTVPGMRGRSETKCFSPGDLILKRYKVVSELGSGSMGIVYRCTDTVSGSDIAVKVLPSAVIRNPQLMEEVNRNFQLIRPLSHPNIAAVRSLEKDEQTGDAFLLMEYVPGEDLKSYFLRKRSAEGVLTPAEILPVIRQIASALDHARKMKIAHRDIKPQNIIITPDGRVKILDFGIAALISSGNTPAQETTVSGTAPYRAPEQWLGVAPAKNTDQYALAVIVYEMLAGYLPFESQDQAKLRDLVLNTAPQKPAGVSQIVWKIVAKALNKRPEKRFPSCSMFTGLIALTESWKSKKIRYAAAGAVCLLAAVCAVFAAAALFRPSPQLDVEVPSSPVKHSPRLLIRSREDIRKLKAGGLSQGLLQQLALQYGFETMNPEYVKSSRDYDFVIDVKFSGAYRLETFSFNENLKLHGFSLGADLCATYPNGRLIAQTTLPSKDYRIGRIADPVEALRAALHRRIAAKDEISFHNILLDILEKWCRKLKEGMTMSVSILDPAGDFNAFDTVFYTLKSKNLLSEYTMRNQSVSEGSANWDLKTKLQTGEIARLFVVLSEGKLKVKSMDYGKIIFERK